MTGLKDHQIAALNNALRDQLKERLPPLRDVGCLREIIARITRDYLTSQNLRIDHPN